MKRDMEFVREVLLKIEGASAPISSPSLLDEGPSDESASRAMDDPSVMDQSASTQAEDKLTYTLEMLTDHAGFVTGRKIATFGGTTWLDLKLTWQGHEFLETIRDPEVWAKTKEGARKAGNLSIDLIVDLAKAYGKHVVKERLGVDI